MGDVEEMNTRRLGKICDESVRGSLDKTEIPSCQRCLRLKWGCSKDLCCHIFFMQLW